MKTIETVVNVTPERQITVQLPPNIPAGEYQVVIVLNESGKSEQLAAKNQAKRFSKYRIKRRPLLFLRFPKITAATEFSPSA